MGGSGVWVNVGVGVKAPAVAVAAASAVAVASARTVAFTASATAVWVAAMATVGVGVAGTGVLVGETTASDSVAVGDTDWGDAVTAGVVACTTADVGFTFCRQPAMDTPPTTASKMTPPTAAAQAHTGTLRQKGTASSSSLASPFCFFTTGRGTETSGSGEMGVTCTVALASSRTLSPVLAIPVAVTFSIFLPSVL